MQVSECRWEGGYLILKTADVDARHFAYTFKPGEYKLDPVKGKRSLDANAYAWILIDKLAAATGVSKTDVYRNAVRDVGGNSDIVCLKTDAVKTFCRNWESNGLGWMTETMPSKISSCTNVVCYAGSSCYDRTQMSRLIDLLIQDCKAVGIETMPPEKLAALIGGWDAQTD